MNQRYRNLGITTVWQRRHPDEDREDGVFRRRLRQIEAGAAELNLDSNVVHLAAEIAALQSDLDDERRLALIVLVTASLAELQEGSTRLPVVGEHARAPMGRIAAPLCGDEFPGGVGAVCGVIAQLLDGGLAPEVVGSADGDARPLIYRRPFIYHQRVRLAELALARLLAERLRQNPVAIRHKEIETALDDITKRPGGTGEREFVLSAEQIEAVNNAAGHRLALISGGPGTGKTSIIMAILRVLVRMGIEPKKIELAAPTGKAAFRMGESIDEGLRQIANPASADQLLKGARLEPRTIHRLLGYSPGRGRFLYHRNNQLDAAAVIVDESSMLDLALMERLMSALKPDTRLILLGDADQLPSVAAGAVFRDVVQAAQALAQGERFQGVCTRLTHSYRMDTSEPAGAAVFSVATAINAADQSIVQPGGQGESAIVWRSRPEELEFTGVEFLKVAGPIDEFLHRWYSQHVGTSELDEFCAQPVDQGEAGFVPQAQSRLQEIFDYLAASRILCFTRVLPAGSERINAVLHRRRADALGKAAERDFLAGEPVIVVRNDYERTLFNGDQGVIVPVRRASRVLPMAVFRRGGQFVAFHVAALREYLELCYATTIHKAQGSEFDAVAIILPDRDLPLLTREALYTAVSRGRRGAVLVGDPEQLRAGIGRAMERFSGLAEELTGLLAQQRN